MRRPSRIILAVLVSQAAVAWQAAATPVKWSGNGHLYETVLVPQGLNWVDAQAAVAARGCGWYLATITTKAEDTFVFGLIQKNPQLFIESNGPWLGAFQKSSRAEPAGNWRWVTDEPFTYTNWAPGEPSNKTFGKQDVEPGVPKGLYEGFLSHKASGLWNDHHMNALFHGYVAEFDTAEQARCRARG